MSRRKQAQTKEVRPDQAAAPTAPDFAMLDRVRSHVGEPPAPTRALVMRDLEATKRMAFEGLNVASAVRAIELQGRAIGAFEEQDPEAEPKMLTDEELCTGIANGNEALADALLKLLETGTLGPGLALGNHSV